MTTHHRSPLRQGSGLEQHVHGRKSLRDSESSSGSEETRREREWYDKRKAAGIGEGKLQGILMALNDACESGERAAVERILQMLPAVPEKSLLDSDGWLPIHYAARGGNAETFRLLLENEFSPSFPTPKKDTALHIACKHGNKEVVDTILEYQHGILHDTASSSNPSESVFMHNVLTPLNSTGQTVLGCAVSESHFDIARELFKHAKGDPVKTFPDFPTLFSALYHQSKPLDNSLLLDKPVKIFVMGDQEVGKSTLTKALQGDRTVLSWLTLGISGLKSTVQGVDRHFTGVITTDFSGPGYKRVIFYDLAGHTNYFHHELLESADDITHSIFIIVVSSKEEKHTITQRMVYWMNFLYYHCSKYKKAISSGMKPNVFIVGSFNDYRKSFWHPNVTRLTQIYNHVNNSHKKLCKEKLHLLGKISLSCPKYNSPYISQLRTQLHRQCQLIRPHGPLPPSQCYLLSRVLELEFSDKPTLSIGELCSCIAAKVRQSVSTWFSLLPSEPEEILQLCQINHERKRLHLFDNPSDERIESTWIVHNSHHLLTLIDEKLSSLREAPEDAEEKLHSTFGIVSLKCLQQSLASEPNPIHLDIHLTIQLLERFKYCEKVNPSYIGHEEMAGASPDQPCYFFPGMLPTDGELFWPPADVSSNCFGFTWCLIPSEEQEHFIEYFLPRFLKMVLLSIVQMIVTYSSPKKGKVWSRGACWETEDGGVDIGVVTHDDSIVLSMRCQEHHEIQFLQLRNQAIQAIREEKRKWQPETSTKEVVIPMGINPATPIRDPVEPQILVSAIQEAIIEGKDEITLGRDKIPWSIESLLLFEPALTLQRMEGGYINKLIDPKHASQKISPKFVENLASCVGEKYQDIALYFQLPPATLPREAVMEVDEKSYTYGELLQCLNSIGIFNTSEILHEVKGLASDEESNASTYKDDELDVNALQLSMLSNPEQALSGMVHTSYQLAPHRIKKKDELEKSGLANIPFINPVEIFMCDSFGGVYHSEVHSISLKFPPGAIPKGSPPIEIEVGVTLQGPFDIAENAKPVSPILWFCTKNFEFHKPIEITLPHFINCSTRESCEKLAFFKAGHHSTTSTSRQHFIFEQSLDSTLFQQHSSQGVLFTTHTCFLCVCHKEPEAILWNANYCLVSVIPSDPITESIFKVHFCLTYFIDTCIETVHRQFPEGYEIEKRRVRLAEDREDTCVGIEFANELNGGWIAGLLSGNWEILPTEIDFWTRKEGELVMMQRHLLYPPRFTIKVNGSMATRPSYMNVFFSGLKQKMKIQVVLSLPTPLSRTISPLLHFKPHHHNNSSTSNLTLSEAGPASRAISPASGAVSRILDSIFHCLKEYLDMDQIRDHLRMAKILTDQEHQTLLSAEPPIKPVEMLVLMLKRKGEGGLKQFKAILEKTMDGTGHRLILEELNQNEDFQEMQKFWSKSSAIPEERWGSKFSAVHRPGAMSEDSIGSTSRDSGVASSHIHHSQSLSRLISPSPPYIGQHHLTASYPSSSNISASSIDSMPDVPASGAIGRILDTIKECLDMDLIKAHLHTAKFLTDQEQYALLSAKSPTNPVDMFVAILQRKGERGLKWFKSILEITTEGTRHRDILEELNQNEEFQEMQKHWESKFSTVAKMIDTSVVQKEEVMLPYMHKVLPIKKTENHPEFIGSVDTIVCSYSGGVYHNPMHGVTLRIPEGAIPQGERWTISIGVRLYGDFILPENVVPVSPFVWLCSPESPQKMILKPVKVIIPHFFDNEHNANMHFMKAGHGDRQIKFDLAEGHEDFSSVPNKGVLLTQHFCYVCITTQDFSKNYEKWALCITCAIPRPILSGSRIYFYITYFNDTCLNDMESKFVEGYSIAEQRRFRFSSVPEGIPAIAAQYQCSAADSPSHVTKTLQPTEITLNDVDFQKLHEKKQLELMHERKLYPPYMKLTLGELPLSEETITMSFRGIQESDNQMDIKIIIPSRGGTPSNTQAPTVQPRARALPALKDEIMMRQLLHLRTVPPIRIVDELAVRWEDLGYTINFDSKGNHVQLIKKECGAEGPVACCRRVLIDWLNGRGDYQPPTWENLLEIVNDMEDSLATILCNFFYQPRID